MKTQLLLILFLFVFTLNAQEKVQFIKNGVLTMKNNEKIEFSNLRYEENKVVFTNLKNQTVEHLFLESILSIDEGNVEFVNESDINKLEKPNFRQDGIYFTLNNLNQEKFQSSKNYKVIVKSHKRNLYYIEDENGKKLDNAFVVIKDGTLYVRGAGIREYQKEKRSLNFSGNKKLFVKMDLQYNVYEGKAPFTNRAISIPGAIMSGVGAGIIAPGVGSAVVFAAGGASLFSLAAAGKRDIVIDIQNEKLYLR